MNMTMERASEIIKSHHDSDMRIDLFCHFENILNPFDPLSEQGAEWQKMFAVMCGYGLAINVEIEGN